MVDGDNFPALIGVEFGEIGREVAEARMPVTQKLMQPYGIVHGGALAALAETIASYATAVAVQEDGMIAVGQGNAASFLRPFTAGTIHAVARARHTGRTTWVWDVELSDDEGRLCTLVRMTVAVRPSPSG